MHELVLVLTCFLGHSTGRREQESARERERELSKSRACIVRCSCNFLAAAGLASERESKSVFSVGVLYPTLQIVDRCDRVRVTVSCARFTCLLLFFIRDSVKNK